MDQPASGNVLVYFRVRNSESRMQIEHLLVNLPGERIASSIYEISTEDWDEGLWDEEVRRMRGIIDPATDTLLFWHVVEGCLMRTCIAGRFA